MTTGGGRDAARWLAAQAGEVGRVPERLPWATVLRRISGGRWGRQRVWQVVPRLDTPWQDSPSTERGGWRQREANLGGEPVFGVDYLVCRSCRLGWVEQPFTDPSFQRCGLASAALRALREENPGMAWHTLGGHLGDSKPFWGAVGAGVPGSYGQWSLCPHVENL